MQGGTHAEAAAFFVKLAETTAKPEQKGDALRHADIATARNKQLETALLLTDKIPLKPGCGVREFRKKNPAVRQRSGPAPL